MTEQDAKLIEGPTRLSQSQLWQIQRNYFASMGVKAWKEEVPCYISSNAFVGNQYAWLVVNFIQDWRRLNPAAKDHTFYLAELGSGAGKFSFHFLQAFKVALQQTNLTDQKFCYIITDVVENNLKFCQENQGFSEFIANDECDFARFNVEEDKDFFLIRKNKKYSELNAENPLIIIANYTFDCIKQDAFAVTNGKIEELRLELRSRYSNFDTQKALHLNDLRLDYESAGLNLNNYYENPILNELLAYYQNYFTQANATIMLPLGALQFFDNMSSLTHENYFLIAGDKGIAQQDKFKLLTQKYLMTYDGCYSFSVNFHALGFYASKLNGDSLLTAHANDFKINLYSAGFQFADFEATRSFFNSVIETTGPDEYCFIYDDYASNSYRFTLKSLISFLRLSHWDPDAYAAIHYRLLELFPAVDMFMGEDIKQDLIRVRKNIYPSNIGDDIYSLLGDIYRFWGQDDEAIELYQESIAALGQKADTNYNLALTYDKQKNQAKALEYYQKAYELDNTNQSAKRKIFQLTGRPFLSLIRPLMKASLVFGLIVVMLYVISH